MMKLYTIQISLEFIDSTNAIVLMHNVPGETRKDAIDLLIRKIEEKFNVDVVAYDVLAIERQERKVDDKVETLSVTYH
jgi:hypothetical protein